MKPLNRPLETLPSDCSIRQTSGFEVEPYASNTGASHLVECRLTCLVVDDGDATLCDAMANTGVARRVNPPIAALETPINT